LRFSDYLIHLFDQSCLERGEQKTNTMEEGNNGVAPKNERQEEIFSKAVRAGKRTYFFDVKATKAGDYYLTITESKKKFGDDGKFYYEKHKVFLYKEDFDKFLDGANESIGFVKKEQPYVPPVYNNENTSNETPNTSDNGTTDVKFEDLK